MNNSGFDGETKPSVNGKIIINLEDNTSTQFKPQVKILRRPTSDDVQQEKRIFSYFDDDNPLLPPVMNSTSLKFDSGRSPLQRNHDVIEQERKISNQVKIKTYQERADEYAKARLRILGSSFPSCDSDGSTGGNSNATR